MRLYRTTLLRFALPLALLVTTVPVARASDPFRAPTKEELAMTELPGYPGAPAVVLYREEITLDDLHVVQHYMRIKVLTEAGKDCANVEINFIATHGGLFSEGDDKKVGDIVARTIHKDGTIIPFTGKPYLKTIVKGDGFTSQARVFTLPDVEVGSIIEYRYATRINEGSFEAAKWIIQGDLFIKSAHFGWHPTGEQLTDEDTGKTISAISWLPILPSNAKVQRHARVNHAASEYALDIEDVPPSPKEELMPPIQSLGFRVLFYYLAYKSQDAFWQGTGKHWSKEVGKFSSYGGSLRDAVSVVIAGASTDTEKLQKIYAAVESMQNTRFTREHNQNENKAGGLGKINKVTDVWEHKLGTPTQITRLFLAMADAAGLKAYAMWIPDRSQDLFIEQWLSTYQLDDEIAIVVLDGKETYFDPGERYAPFAHLAWQHTFVRGLRQMPDGSTQLSETSGDPYSFNRTNRVGNFTMDEKDEVTGKIDITYFGSSALTWRQKALEGDDESIRKSLRTDLENMVPSSMEITLKTIDNLTDYEKPLAIHYEVKGTLGVPTGKRLTVPVDIFAARDQATFPQTKRELPICFSYPEMVQDAIKINLPSSVTVEAVPDAGKAKFLTRGGYDLSVVGSPSSVVTRRSFLMKEYQVPLASYPDLRTFYSQMEVKDHESIVLKLTAPAPANGGMN